MKKRKLLSIVTIVLAVALLAGMITLVSFAGTDDPVVVYDHGEKLFIFRNVEKMSYTADDSSATGDLGKGREYPDLFENFKNMMPGDSVTQTITVGAEHLGGGTVEIVLMADRENDTDGDGQDDISQEEQEAFRTLVDSGMMGLTVAWSDESINYTYTSRQLLTEGVSLGKFSNNETRDVTVTLSFSTEAGNELADLQAGIGWIFTARNYIGGGGGTPGGGGSGVDYERGHYAYIIGMPDGLVHPEQSVTRAEVATIFFRMMTEEMREEYWGDVNPFSDVFATDWFNHAVSTLTNAGIVNGRPGNVFAPSAYITRAEFAALAVRFFGNPNGVEVGEEDAFPDIADNWANYEINLAYALDLVEGTGDGTFQPDREITRAEAMTIVNRVLNRDPHKGYLLDNMITWPDNMDTTKWYYAEVQEATNSHNYVRSYGKTGEEYENWTSLLPVRDWAALERQWATLYSSPNPGEVVSSKYSYKFN